jgi:hypothetical protein
MYNFVYVVVGQYEQLLGYFETSQAAEDFINHPDNRRDHLRYIAVECWG